MSEEINTTSSETDAGAPSTPVAGETVAPSEQGGEAGGQEGVRTAAETILELQRALQERDNAYTELTQKHEALTSEHSDVLKNISKMVFNQGGSLPGGSSTSASTSAAPTAVEMPKYLTISELAKL